MDLENIKSSIVNNVYHIPADKKVALHKHPKHDEIFYCIKGEGFGVLENEFINNSRDILVLNAKLNIKQLIVIKLSLLYNNN